MKAGVIFLIVFCIILIGVVIYVFITYEKTQSEIVNISISAEYNRKRVETGFEIIGLISGNTSDSYELVEMEKQLIQIKNVNLKDQSFYENIKEYNITENTRIDLILEKAELPEIDIDYEENIIVNISSANFKEVQFCLVGSLNYMFIRAKDYYEIDKLEGYENYDICYNGDFSLINSYEIINVSFTKFGNPTENDYINLTLIDKSDNSIKKRLI